MTKPDSKIPWRPEMAGENLGEYLREYTAHYEHLRLRDLRVLRAFRVNLEAHGPDVGEVVDATHEGLGGDITLGMIWDVTVAYRLAHSKPKAEPRPVVPPTALPITDKLEALQQQIDRINDLRAVFALGLSHRSDALEQRLDTMAESISDIRAQAKLNADYHSMHARAMTPHGIALSALKTSGFIDHDPLPHDRMADSVSGGPQAHGQMPVERAQ